MHMMVLVLNDPDHLDDVLAAWSEIGLVGVTIMESTGMHRRQGKHVPMRYLFGNVEAEGNYTLFAIVEREETVQACLEATERIIGDLHEPDTGVLAAWPLSMAKGMTPKTQRGAPPGKED